MGADIVHLLNCILKFDLLKLAYNMHQQRIILVLLLLFSSVLPLLAQCPITVNAGEDVYLCPPTTPVQLNGDISGDYLSFTWTPTTGMTGGNTLTPTVTVSQSITYVLTGTAADFSNNLIDNGDFEGGNSGFSSDYDYNPGNLVPEGVYDVLSNPQDAHPGFAPCGDHTSGDGNMMAVNGAGSPNQNVWCQTVPVSPNTNYVFSAWVATLVASSPALLQFNINGTPLGAIFNAPSSTCVWQNYFQIWNSGGNSSATICIVNQNTALGGNDFALDDLFFNATCSETDTVKVNIVNVNAVANPLVTIPCEGSTVQISGVGSSTGPNVTYEWSTGDGNIVSGENTLTPSVDAPGEYVLTVSYVVNGDVICSRTATVNVILNPNPLSAWISTPQPLGCGSPTTLLVGNSTQAAFSVYEWTTQDGNIVSGADLKNCTVSQPGTYTLLVTNSQTGCTAEADVLVTVTTNIPTANANSNGMITCINDSVPLLGLGSSSGPSISYNWTTLAGQIIGSDDSLNTTAGAGGLYILSVTNTSNNCTTRDTVIVPSNVVTPTILDSLPQQITCNPAQDTIPILITVTNPPLVLINWTTSNGNIVSGHLTDSVVVSLPGAYMVSVQNPDNGCFSYDTVQVIANFNAPLAGILPADTITCQSPSIQLQGSGSGSFSILWTATNGGNIVSGENTLLPTINASGNYWLVLQDSLSFCTDTAMVSVQADTNVVVAIANAPDTLNCVVNTVTLNTNGSSNGNLSYVWSTSDGNIVSGQGTPNPTVNAPGIYQLLLTNNANGCSATDLAIVELNNAPPPISINPPDTLTCAVSSQTIQALINGPGIFGYQWTASSGGNIVSGDSTLNPTVNQPGIYTLTATSLTNGCTASASVTVSLEAGFPVVTTAVPGPLTCAALTQILSSSGSSSGPNFTYTWTTQDGNILQGANSANPTVNQAGTYQLQIINNSNGCSSSSNVVVLQDTTAPTALVLTPADTLNCLSTQFELIGDGTGNGVWTTSNGNILFTTGFTAQIDAPGNYVFSTTNPNNGCTATTAVEIFENVQVPGLSLANPATLTCATTQITLDATASGQNLGFNWQTSNGNLLSGQNTPMPEVNAPGNYSITVTDGINGCSTTGSLLVLQNITPPNIQIAATPTINCNSLTQTIQAQNLIPAGNFVFNWMASNGGNIVSGASSLNPLVNSGGAYTLTASNSDNGCTAVFSTSVLQDTNLPSVDAGISDTLSCLTNSLTINGSGSGASNLNFVWLASGGGNIVSGGNSPTPLVDQPGTYTLTVTNPVNGCSAVDQVQIFNDANAPSANAGTAATLTCSVLQTTLNGTASTGANISYNWTAAAGGNIVSGQNTLTPTVNEPGTYTLFVTNALNGCVASSTVTVPENVIPPMVDAGASVGLSCAITSLNLDGTASASSTVVWTTGNGNIVSGSNALNPTINQTGTYTLTATLSSNGCTASDVITVTIDTLAPGFQIQTPGLLTCAQQSTTVNASVIQPGAGNFSANWSTQNGNLVSGQNTLTATVNAPGLYFLTIQNLANGCDAQQQVIVNQDVTPPTVLTAPGGDITCALPSLNLSGNGSATGNGISYAWTASAGGTILSGANTLTPTVGSAGTYTLQVNNALNGCFATSTTTVGNNTTPPVAAITQPGTLTCTQNTVALDGTGSSQGPGFSANWATSGGNIVSGQGTFSVLVNEAGNYLLTVIDATNGCTATTQILVQENLTTPGALILPVTPLHCNQAQITLLGSSPTVGALNYAWSTAAGGNILSGANTSTPLINQAGVYTIQVTHPDNGCTSSTSITVTAIPDPAFNPTLTQPNCFQPTGAVNFGAVSGGLLPYQYSLDGGQSFGNQALFLGLEPDAYTLVVSDANGCTVAETVTVDQPFLPILNIADIQKIEQGDSILLSPLTNIPAVQIASWEWSPAAGLSCVDCAEPWAKPLYSQYYTVKVEDLDGCIAEERILVQVSRKRHIYPPTVFSPNDDGENDRFTLYTKGVREIRRLAIFDRWGEELFLRNNFQPNDESLGWDGTFRGSPLNPGVYVWAAEVEFIDGEREVIYGDVTVVR